MRLFGLVFAVLFFVLPLRPAHASLEAIMARLDLLEQENAVLKRRVAALERQAVTSGSQSGSAAATAAANPRSATPMMAAASVEATASGFASSFPDDAPDRWSRTYLGIQGGYAIGEPEYPFLGDAFDGATFSGRIEDTNFGLQIGQTWQFGSFVAGVELQARKENIESDTEGRSEYSVLDGANLYNYTGVGIASLDVDWSAAAKGKLGVATDTALLYGTLGVTAADITETYESITLERLRVLNTPIDQTIVTHGANVQTSSIQIGLLAGFGFEYALTQNLSIGAEYEYAWFGDRSFAPTGADPALDWHTASARLNLSF